MRKAPRFTKLFLAGSITVASILAFGCGGKPVQQVIEVDKSKADADAKAKAEADRLKAEAEAKARKAKEDMEARLRAEAAAAEEARLRAEAEARAARTYVITYFDFDRSNIRDDQRAGVTLNADKLKANVDIKATLEGYCDERGTNEYNIALGQRRADSVKSFLVKSGVAADRLRTVSYGEERPADAGHNETAWALNRRVETVAAP